MGLHLVLSWLLRGLSRKQLHSLSQRYSWTSRSFHSDFERSSARVMVSHGRIMGSFTKVTQAFKASLQVFRAPAWAFATLTRIFVMPSSCFHVSAMEVHSNFRGEIVGDFMGAVTILRVIVRSECDPRTHHYRECFHAAAIEVHSNFRGEIIGDFMGAVTILWVTVRFECVPRTHHYRVYLVYNQAPGPGTAPLPWVLVVRRQHAGYGSETVAPKRLYQVRLRLTRGALCSTPGMRLTLNLS